MGEKPHSIPWSRYDRPMRSRIFVALAALGSFAIPYAAYAAIPFFGPIIPPGVLTSVCPAGWGMLITVINNIISFLITVVIVFIAPLMIAYAGFLFVVNPVNSSGIAKAKEILLNTVVGIVLALAGYLIVDAVMAVLYDSNAQTGNGTLGAWAQIINWNGQTCLPQMGALPGAELNQATALGITTGSLTRTTTFLTAEGNPCNPSTVTSSANEAGYQVSDTQAKLLACVARGESTCGTNNPPYNLNYSWNKPTANGSASTAAGAYQVLLSTNSICYDNAVCESAAGTPGVPLNCRSGFDSKGFVIPGSSTVALCQKAAGNIKCSAAAAACLLQKQSFASAYATDPYTGSCINAYGGG